MNSTVQLKSRHDMEFEVSYSMRLERMNATLLRRMCLVTWTLLGIFTVHGVNAGSHEFGSCLAAYAIAIFLFMVRPGAAAAASAASCDRWGHLHARMGTMSDRELARAISVVERQDGQVLSVLKLVAHREAASSLDLDLSEVPALNVLQRFAASMAGSTAA